MGDWGWEMVWNLLSSCGGIMIPSRYVNGLLRRFEVDEILSILNHEFLTSTSSIYLVPSVSRCRAVPALLCHVVGR